MASDGAMLALFDRQMRREAVPDEAGLTILREECITRARGPGAGPEDHCILWSDLDEATADSAIARESARAGSEMHALEWKVYGQDRPGDLGDRLMAWGFEPDEPETLVCFDLRNPVSPPEGIRVRRLGKDDLHALAQIHAAVRGPEAASQIETLRRTLRELPERLSIHLAEDEDGRPASVGWLRKPPGVAFASLWGGATLPEMRGRGFYRALVAARLKEAREAGYAYVTVDARETSRPILERLGFATLTSVRGYVWRPASR